MSKLIDADKLRRIFEDSECPRELQETLLEIVDEQPTAFDVDKVVKQLEDRSVLSRPVGWSKAYEIITLEDAIKIVKGGGVE